MRAIAFALVLAGCNGTPAGADGGLDAISVPIVLFNGAYLSQSNVTQAEADAAAVQAARDALARGQWTRARTLADTGPLAEMLTRLDSRYPANSPAGAPYLPSALLRDALRAGEIAPTVDATRVASARSDAALSVLLELALTLRATLVLGDMTAAAPSFAAARDDWDSAAVYYAALDPWVRQLEAGVTAMPFCDESCGVGSPGISSQTTALLQRGSGAINAFSVRYTAEDATTLLFASTRAFALATLRAAAADAMSSDRAAGGVFVEGVLTPMTAWGVDVTSARALWSGAMPASAVRLTAGSEARVYAAALSVVLSTFSSEPMNYDGGFQDALRWSQLGAVAGSVEALADAFALDPASNTAALSAHLVTARLAIAQLDFAAGMRELWAAQAGVSALGSLR